MHLEVVERDRPAVAARDLGRALVAAVGDAQDADALAAQDPRGHLAALARAHEHHPALGERAERLAGELDRRRGDGHAGPRDPGAGAHAAAGAERVAHQAVEERPARARLARELVGAAQLTEDLGLAEHHRVEAGGDGEEMVGDGAAAQCAQPEPERRGGHAGVARERGDRGPLGAIRASAPAT